MRWVFALVLLAAVTMGAPSLRGTYLGGDDVQLVRDHVLVNRPSLAHLAELFSIAHRDLYQPVALASFQLDFVVVRGLGLTPASPGETPGAWVLHLTNVLLHGLCAVLVCAVARRVTGRVAVAAVAGVIFALHPLNVETVAWINGRMMLLSTVFLLAALLMLEQLAARGGWWRGALVLLFVCLCHMSKVRPMLPALVALPWVVRRVWPVRRWWYGWGPVAVATLGFTILNVAFSEGMLSGGAEHLHGSRVARTLLAMGWYVSRLVVPVGLCPYHPTAETVDWSYPGLAFAGAVVVTALVVSVVSARWTRLGWSGALWFVVALAVTLPLVGARNLAFAERYMYLPLVGVLWPVAAGLVAAARRMPGWARGSAGVVLATGLCAVSWHAIGFYRNDVSRAARMVQLYPEDAPVVLAYADALYRAGKMPAAMARAQGLIFNTDAATASEAWVVIGKARLGLDEDDAAIIAFREAVRLDANSGVAQAFLGGALLRVGEIEEGVRALERSADLAPKYNPGLVILARGYRMAGRVADARRVYEQVLGNNPYDVEAMSGLAELELAAGDFARALPRLREALELAPGDGQLSGLYAWALALAGEWDGARGAVDHALALDAQEPRARMAAVGLALMAGDAGLAVSRAEALLSGGLLADAGEFDAFAAVVQAYAQSRPADPWPYYVMALACKATGRVEAAKVAVEACKQLTDDPQLRRRAEAILGKR